MFREHIATESKNVPKIRAFCLGTAILGELHGRVAVGAIRACAVSTHHVGSHRPGYRGETRLALTDRAAGFLVCGFQKKAPKRLLVGAKAGKS